MFGKTVSGTDVASANVSTEISISSRNGAIINSAPMERITCTTRWPDRGPRWRRRGLATVVGPIAAPVAAAALLIVHPFLLEPELAAGEDDDDPQEQEGDRCRVTAVGLHERLVVE